MPPRLHKATEATRRMGSVQADVGNRRNGQKLQVLADEQPRVGGRIRPRDNCTTTGIDCSAGLCKDCAAADESMSALLRDDDPSVILSASSTCSLSRRRN